ncbi:MAG TPA: ATP-binding protein [Anaerolineales bacterium]
MRSSLFLVIIGFLLIITLSMAFNQLSIEARSRHEAVLTTAYKHRNTTQTIVTEISLVDDNTPDISAQITEFDQSLQKLRDFGNTSWVLSDLLVSPAIIHPNYGKELDQISASWSRFQTDWVAFKQLSTGDPSYNQARWSVMDSLAVLMKHVDTFSDTLEQVEAQEDQNVSRWQFVFFGLGLLLMIWGGYFIVMRVIRPLSYLDTVVQQIGRGQMEQPIRIAADDELGRLAHSYENMRLEVAASQKLLEERVDERTRILTAAFEFSQKIVSQPDLKNIIASVSQQARDLMHADFASLCFIPEFSSKVDPSSGLRKPATGIMTRANLKSPGSNDIPPVICENHPSDPAKDLVSVPIQIGSHCIGCLCVARDHKEPFSELDVHTLKLLANSTAVVIENIRLMESQRREAELNGTLTERQRIASELHDEAAQTLSLLNLKVSELESFSTLDKEKASLSVLPQFNALIQKAQSQMRMASSGLSGQPVTKPGDLSSDLQNYVDEFRRTSGIAFNLMVDDLSDINIPVLVQKQIMYIFREALTNVKRYSQAKNVKVWLQNLDNGIHVAVSDDGVGFDPNISRSDHHFGLSVMQMRTERIGGALVIETAPGKGTRVAAFIPLTSLAPGLQTDKDMQ